MGGFAEAASNLAGHILFSMEEGFAFARVNRKVSKARCGTKKLVKWNPTGVSIMIFLKACAKGRKLARTNGSFEGEGTKVRAAKGGEPGKAP